MAVVAAFVVAEAAVLLLRPRDGVIAPAPVDPGSYFTPDQLDRARDYRRGQLIIFAFGLVGLKIAVDESWGWTIHNGFTIFIVGGLVKAAIGAAVLPSAWGLVRKFER